MDQLQNILQDIEDEEDERIVGIERRQFIRADPYNEFSDREFKRRFRLDKESAAFICDEIKQDLQFPSNRNNPIPPMSQFLLTLRLYATGCFLLVIADFMGVSHSSAQRIVHRVTTSICRLRRKYLRLPENNQELKAVQRENFKMARFPKVLGFIDGTHVEINSPGGAEGELYRNRKSYFSLNVQAVANADLKFMDVVARWPGSAHDVTIFNSSTLCAKLEMGNFEDTVILGDSAYPLSPYLMTPVANAITPAEQEYNRCHIFTRGGVERSFGLWKRRFPIIALGTQLNITNVMPIVVATMILHNILQDLNDDDPPSDPTVVPDWDRALLNFNQIPRAGVIPRNRVFAEAVRRKLIDYFATLI